MIVGTSCTERSERERERERERGRCLLCVTAAVCGEEEENERSLPMRFLVLLYTFLT